MGGMAAEASDGEHVGFLKKRFEGYQVEVGMHAGEEFSGESRNVERDGVEVVAATEVDRDGLGGRVLGRTAYPEGDCGLGLADCRDEVLKREGDNMAMWKNLKRRVSSLLVGVFGCSVGAVGVGG